MKKHLLATRELKESNKSLRLKKKLTNHIEAKTIKLVTKPLLDTIAAEIINELPTYDRYVYEVLSAYLAFELVRAVNDNDEVAYSKGELREGLIATLGYYASTGRVERVKKLNKNMWLLDDAFNGSAREINIVKRTGFILKRPCCKAWPLTKPWCKEPCECKPKCP